MKHFIYRHEQKLRYLAVGGWNTLFGYLLFVALYARLGGRINYIAILVVSYVISISNAYLCYKFLVFKTRGNYLREYLRFYLVYGLAFLINLALLPLLVEVLKLNPVVSQGAIVFFTVVISYMAHKNFSFNVAVDELEHE